MNINPNIGQPFGISGEKILSFCWCKSDPILVEMEIPKQGYVPGEEIDFNIIVQNNTKKEIKSLEIHLCQIIDFSNDKSNITDTKTIEKIVNSNKIKSINVYKWNNCFLVIPNVCPSTIDKQFIISVKYKVVLEFTEFGKSSEKFEIPIEIGTIKLKDQIRNDRNIKAESLSNLKLTEYTKYTTSA